MLLNVEQLSMRANKKLTVKITWLATNIFHFPPYSICHPQGCGDTGSNPAVIWLEALDSCVFFNVPPNISKGKINNTVF